MVLISIVLWSLSSNKLGNNFKCDTNLLMPMLSLLISNKKFFLCNWLASKNSFWWHQELKMWISVALFEQKKLLLTILHMSFFEQKQNSFIKIRERDQSSNHNFRIHQIWARKSVFLEIHTKTNSNSRLKKIQKRLNTLSHRLLDGDSLEVPAKYYVVKIKMIWNYIS